MALNSKGDRNETIIQKNSSVAITVYNGDNDSTQCNSRDAW